MSKLFAVYHFTIPRNLQISGRIPMEDDVSFLPKPEQVARVWANQDAMKPHYVKVADLMADDLDEVFEKTNHIDRSWTENEGIVWNADRVRSTSVGDIIVAEDQKRFFVAGMGFEEF